MSAINLNQIPKIIISPETQSLKKLDNLLKNAEIQHTKTGKRYVIAKNTDPKNSFVKVKIDFDTLSALLEYKVRTYSLPINKDKINFEESSFLKKFETKTKEQLSTYNEDFLHAENILKKITTLDQISKEAIKKAGIITRIFFFFIQLFIKKRFSYNLKQTESYIKMHQDIIKEIKLKIEPFDAYQKKYGKHFETFNKATTYMAIANVFNVALSFLGLGIPYINGILNYATVYKVGKFFYDEFNTTGAIRINI